MVKKDLLLHLPVIHKGYIDFFNKNKKKIGKIYVMHESLVNSLSKVDRDIASLKSGKVKQFLESLGFTNIEVANKNDLKKLKGLMLINDEISRSLVEKYLKGKKIEWQKVFLRWDKQSVISSTDIKADVSKNPFDKKMMKEAYKEAEKSSDWWRQVGAVLAKNKRIILRSYNKGVPSDHTPYQVGAIRDFLNVGEKPELSSTIHAEQLIISSAAKEGISLKGTTLYITHFPCAVCAKLIAFSGIKACHFGESSSNTEGLKTLESQGVSLKCIQI